MSEQTIKPGDVVKHLPTGEEWEVSAVSSDGRRLSPTGWPESIADVSDCEFISSGTEEQEKKLVEHWAKKNSGDIRSIWNRQRLEAQKPKESTSPAPPTVASIADEEVERWLPHSEKPVWQAALPVSDSNESAFTVCQALRHLAASRQALSEAQEERDIYKGFYEDSVPTVDESLKALEESGGLQIEEPTDEEKAAWQFEEDNLRMREPLEPCHKTHLNCRAKLEIGQHEWFDDRTWEKTAKNCDSVAAKIEAELGKGAG